MTYQNNFTLPAELLEQIASEGLDFLPELVRIMINAATQIDREKYLGAGHYERTPERRGHANGFKPKTVKTLIDRLVKKGAVKFEKEGRRHRYYPAVERDECIATERQSFIRRVYGGITKPMLAAFLEDAELSAEDISELKEILEEKAEG